MGFAIAKVLRKGDVRGKADKMKQMISAFIGVVLCGSIGWAQVLPEGGGARAGALGQAYTAVQADIWGGMYYNPASLTGLKKGTLGVDVEQRYGLSELFTGRAAVALPIGNSETGQTIGLGLSAFGFPNYQSMRLTAGYGIRAFDRLDLGVRLHYQNMTVTGYGTGSAFIADLGFVAKLNDQLSLAGRAQNVNQARLKTAVGEDVLASTFAAGFIYLPNKKTTVLLDLEKSELFPASLRLGVAYQFHEILEAQVGTHTQPLGWSGGFSVKKDSWNLNIAGRYHERLGFFPQVSLHWSWGKGGKDED